MMMSMANRSATGMGGTKNAAVTKEPERPKARKASTARTPRNNRSGGKPVTKFSGGSAAPLTPEVPPGVVVEELASRGRLGAAEGQERRGSGVALWLAWVRGIGRQAGTGRRANQPVQIRGPPSWFNRSMNARHAVLTR